jgi:hypothetical protein
MYPFEQKENDDEYNTLKGFEYMHLGSLQLNEH